MGVISNIATPSRCLKARPAFELLLGGGGGGGQQASSQLQAVDQEFPQVMVRYEFQRLTYKK